MAKLLFNATFAAPAEAEACPATVFDRISQFLFWAVWPLDDKAGRYVF